MTEPKDVREMRQRINEVSRGYDRMDGESVGTNRISMVANTIRACRMLGERDGWSGEDTMTAIAFYALRDLEKAYDRQLEMIYLTPPERFIIRADSTTHALHAKVSDGPVIDGHEAKPAG